MSFKCCDALSAKGLKNLHSLIIRSRSDVIVHDWIPSNVEDFQLVGPYHIELFDSSFYHLVEIDVSTGSNCELGLVKWIPYSAIYRGIMFEVLDDF